MSYAVVFSGQGTQHPGMLPWLEDEPACHPLIATLAETLEDWVAVRSAQVKEEPAQQAGETEQNAMPHSLRGVGWRALLHDADVRSRNGFAQPLIVGTSLAAWAALQAHLAERPAVVGGYSVGELSAYACAGVFAPSTAMALAQQRATAMDAAAAGLEGGLLSVSGLSADAVLHACPGLDRAIDIAADQAIYAGPAELLVQGAQTLAAQGALCKRLDVRVPSHSHWMAPAATQFAAHLQDLPFARPHAQLALNATGAVSRQPETLRQALSQQIATTVQWAACMDAIAEQGVHCVLEVGAGSALSKMWNQRHPAIAARSIEEFRDAAGAANWVERMGLR